MLPTFPESEIRVIWDADLQRFRDADTGRFISKEEGVAGLTWQYTESGVRFRDSAGRFTPNPAKLVYGTDEFAYTNVTRKWVPVGDEAYNYPAEAGSYYVSLAIYRGRDGSLKSVFVPHVAGQEIDLDAERRRLAGAIAVEEKVAMGEMGSDRIIDEIVMVFHFQAE